MYDATLENEVTFCFKWSSQVQVNGSKVKFVKDMIIISIVFMSDC